MPTSTDARDVMDDPGAGRPTFHYESTADGDIVVHETEAANFPPPGSGGNGGPETLEHHQHPPTHYTPYHPIHPHHPAAPPPHHPHHPPPPQYHHPGVPPPTAGHHHQWPSQEMRKPSSMKRHGRHHSRNLSAHFFDATKISSAEDDDEAQVDKTTFKKEGGSPAAGQKHRRMFSGDVSNPPLAHRRINSIGNAAAVDRFLQRPRSRHRREDSAGLDILSAAADVTNDELADAAGARTTPVWEGAPPTSATNNAGSAPTYHSRYNSLDLYDYGNAPGAAPPAPSSRPPSSTSTGGPMKPPPARVFSHPHPHAVAPGYGPPPPTGHHHPHHPHHPPPTVSYHHHGPYPPHSPYYAPPPPGHPAARSTGYPVQYSRHPPPPDMYKQQGPPPQSHAMYAPPPPPGQHVSTMAPPAPSPPTGDSSVRQPSPTAPFGDEKIESDERLFNSPRTTTVPPGGKGNSDEDNDENANVNPAEPPRPSNRGAHHRKLSSFSSLNGLMGSSIFSPGGGDNSEHPLKSHHRNTSSTVSFLQGLDVLEGSDVMFLRNLHASTPHYGGGPPPLSSSGPPPLLPPQSMGQDSHGNPPPINAVHQQEMKSHARQQRNGDDLEGRDGSKLASGGTSKRIRRKCTVANCPNRVVQGGLCISHGAKRKICGHPGCTKNVKKAGMCSTHGPARRRCDDVNCNKVAVQGGRCIAHGAKKKLCSVENCKKQAILTGMCKKHHDKLGADPNFPMTCTVIGSDGKGPSHKSGHTRGLSIFQDLSADAVQNLLAGDDPLAL